VVRSAWCVVRSAWCVVRGAWCVVRGPPSAVRRLLSAVCCPPSAVRRLLPAVRRLPPVIFVQQQHGDEGHTTDQADDRENGGGIHGEEHPASHSRADDVAAAARNAKPAKALGFTPASPFRHKGDSDRSIDGGGGAVKHADGDELAGCVDKPVKKGNRSEEERAQDDPPPPPLLIRKDAKERFGHHAGEGGDGND
jgi:hypothetical protein